MLYIYILKCIIVLLGYLSCVPPNPLSNLPYSIVCWRLPITNGTNELPGLLPPALVQPLGGIGRSGSRERYLFPQLPKWHAAVSSGCVLPKSKVSIGQSSSIAALGRWNCPSHHSLGQAEVMAPCCCQRHGTSQLLVYVLQLHSHLSIVLLLDSQSLWLSVPSVSYQDPDWYMY